MPELPIYSASLLNTNVKYFAKFINNFVQELKLNKVILVGNSLGGHVALVHAKLFPSDTKALVLTGSSGYMRMQWVTLIQEEVIMNL